MAAIDDAHTMTGAYVLDAIHGHERAYFERHLARCSTCKREVAEFQATATRLGLAATTGAPPPRVRHAVLTAIHGTRQEQRRGPLTRLRGAQSLVSVAAAVLLVVTVALGVTWAQTEADRDQLHGQVAAATSVLGADDVQLVRAHGANGGDIAVVFSPARDRAVLLADLPPAPSGHDYQAWLIGDGVEEDAREPVRSAGLVGTDRVAFLDVPDLDGAGRLSLTLEPTGGSTQPTTPPLLSARITNR